MEPSQFTRVTGVIAVFAGIAAIVLNDPGFYLASFSLVLFAAALALRFRVRVYRIVRSSRVTRSLDRVIVPQGGTASITTSFSCSPEPDIAVRIRDLHPSATLVEPFDPVAVISRDGTATVRYHITPLLPGRTMVTGIELKVFDPFWTTSIVMTSAPFRGPELKVFPHAAYERHHPLQHMDIRERDAPIIYRGSSIRSFREYQDGDELRFIDWKMTAKHDRMFIREYTTVENIAPLIILDLPDRSTPVPDDLMASLVSSVSSEAASVLRSSGLVSLVIISGVNLRDLLLAEPDIRQIAMMIQKSAHPQFRLHYAYRWKTRAGMWLAIRNIGSSSTHSDENLFPARILRIYRHNLASPYLPLFSAQIQQLLSSHQIKEVILFSLFKGDLSHVHEIAFQAKTQGLRLKLQTVAGQDPARITAIRSLPGMDSLEVPA